MKRTIVLCGLIAVCLAGAAQVRAERQPNVVLIISDDHAWTDYGFMGHPDIKTPRLDKLASESMVYTWGYVPTALCRPSLATMMTGLYPHQHGITSNDPPGDREAARDPAARAEMVRVFGRNKNVAELLREKGYVSFQSGKWWEGNPLEHGFTAAMTHGDVTRRGRHGDDGLKIGREGMQPIYDFIDSAGEKPFFLWYAPFLPHSPHNPPERLLKKYQTAGRPLEMARYYAMVEWLDETTGELLDYIDRKGLREDTLVLYVADNGWLQAAPPQQQSGMRGKMSPYEAGIRTPIMMRWPGKVEPGRDEENLVGSIDFAPTILRAAGIEPLPAMPGIDLRDPRAIDNREALFGALFAHTAVSVDRPVANLKYRYVMRRDGWKLILPYGPNSDVPLLISGTMAPWMRSEPELYDVRKDPHEKNDLAKRRPDLVKELRAALAEWWTVPE